MVKDLSLSGGVIGLAAYESKMRTRCDGGLASAQGGLAAMTPPPPPPGPIGWRGRRTSGLRVAMLCRLQVAGLKPRGGGTEGRQTSNGSRNGDASGPGWGCQSQTARGGSSSARAEGFKRAGGGRSFDCGPLIFLRASRRAASQTQAGREAHLADLVGQRNHVELVQQCSGGLAGPGVVQQERLEAFLSRRVRFGEIERVGADATRQIYHM